MTEIQIVEIRVVLDSSLSQLFIDVRNFLLSQLSAEIFSVKESRI